MFVIETLLPVFAQTILPVFLIAAAGLLLSRLYPLDSRTLGRLLFYLATPSLVFRSLYQMDIAVEALQHLAVVAVTVTAVTGLLGWLASVDQPRQRRAAISLTSAVSNNGNMGMPICLFALGDAGLALGTIYYVINSFMSNTVGVIVASAGRAPVLRALEQSLRVPVLYAAIIGLFLNRTQIELPMPIFRSVDLLAGAAIPGMLILLGIQLHHAPIRERQTVIARSAAIRLVVSPLLAWFLCHWLGITGIERSVLILQAAMPTAVMTAVLATEFDTAPRLVATVIFFTTIASMVTLTLVLWFIL